MRSTVFSPWKIYVLLLSCFCFGMLSAQTFPPGFSQVKVADVFYPTSMAFAPDGRIFVTEKGGKVKIIKNGVMLTNPFYSVSVDQLNERGLSSVAIDPNFNTNHYVYIYYTTASSPIHNRLSRVTASGDTGGSEVTILDFEPVVNSIHNSGGMVFGPDGKLYLAVGNDNVNSNSQDLSNYKGKILRINTDGSVPSGNPFTGSESAKRIWAYGLRNPWSLAIQPGTGRIFANEVGEATWEEINDVTTGGKNFGWPGAEGMSSNPAYTNPVYTYHHGPSGTDFGCAVTGGSFFNPPSTNYPPQYTGKYFFIDYCNKWINYLDLSGGSVQKFNFGTNVGAANNYLKVGPDGNIYYFSISQNALFKIIYSSNNSPVITSQPSSKSIAQSQPVTFNVSASGASTLHYQWQKNGANITGATASSYTINSVQPADAGTYRAVVSNTFGNATSNGATLTVTAFNTRPVATILTPGSGTTYRNGDIISFSGSATDKEDGTLPASAYNWIIYFHHDMHTHPGPTIPAGTKSGNFSSNFGETSANVYWHIVLIVTDSKGLTDTTFVDVHPVTSTLHLASQPSGLQITLEGQPHTTPYSVLAVSQMTRSLGVITPQALNGTNYAFDHWSNGGAATQNIQVADSDRTFTAVFKSTGPAATCTASGTIRQEMWSNVPGTTVATIPVNTTPSSVTQLNIFEEPSNVADNYGSRLRGYICPPQTGNYTFWIASDDNSELWLSTDSNPSNKVKIAYVNAWTHSREWTAYPSQQSAPVQLQSGKKYYIESLHKEGTQGDNLAVGWQLPDGTLERPIPGSRLSPFVPGGNNPPAVSITSPANNAGFTTGSTVTINANAVDADGSVTKVEFFQGSTKLGEDLSAPYSFSWVSVPAGSYTLTAKATDNSGNVATSAGVLITVGTSQGCSATGTILREYWANVPGYQVSNIPVNSPPTGSSQLTVFAGPVNSGDNYGSRIRGYICPPATGNYIFWIASDDNSELWLSTGSDPAARVKIASLSGWTQVNEWTKYATQQSAPIALNAGQKYYIEALHKEGTQGDHVEVGWQLPDGTLERPIPGNRLSPFMGGNTAPSVSITSPLNNESFTGPANILIKADAADSDGTVQKVEFFNGTAKLGEDLTSPYSFNWANVGTGTYKITAVATDNLGASTTSAVVNITVTNGVVCSGNGSILRELWTNVPGYQVADIPVNSPPNSTTTLPIFEEPGNIGDNYGSRLRGYICPPVTGSYTFWISSDDNSELWLSTDGDPAHKARIAHVDAWTQSREWTKYPSQQSVPVNLVAGQKYYIEALHKEGTQGDNLAVGWQLPNGNLERPIPGMRLSPFMVTSSMQEQDVTLYLNENTFTDKRVKEGNLKIFPNPSNGSFHVTYKIKRRADVDLRVFNTTGQVIFSNTMEQAEGDIDREIDLSGQARGIYFLEIRSGKEYLTQKIVLN